MRRLLIAVLARFSRPRPRAPACRSHVPPPTAQVRIAAITVLDSLDDHADRGLVAAVAEHIDGAERAVRRRTGDEEVSVARLLASGLCRLNSAAAASPRADLGALLVRGLLSIAEAHAAGGQGGKPDFAKLVVALPEATPGDIASASHTALGEADVQLTASASDGKVVVILRALGEKVDVTGGSLKVMLTKVQAT